MIDRLRQLAIFAKAIDHGSFRGAAGELRLSPSVVSHHITQLEDHLGVALIYRTTRKLTLTREGERLLFATRNMLGAIEGELAEISGAASEPSGELRLTLPSVLSQSRFTDAIAAFAKTYPRIKLNLTYSDERLALVESGLDIAIRMSLSSPRSRHARALFTVQRRPVASADYVAAQSPVSDPRGLTDWDWLMLTPVHQRGLHFTHADQGPLKIKPAARLSSNDAQSLYRLACAGAGIAVVPEFLATADLASGQMQALVPDWTLDPVTVYAEWPSNAPKQGLIKLLVDALANHALTP